MSNKKYENIINTNYYNSNSPKRPEIDMRGLNFIAGLPSSMGAKMHFSYKSERDHHVIVDRFKPT